MRVTRRYFGGNGLEGYFLPKVVIRTLLKTLTGEINHELSPHMGHRPQGSA